MGHIRAGRMEEATRGSGEWAFVDPGFSSDAKSCGLVGEGGTPSQLTFAQLKAELVALVKTRGRPLNLVLEASVICRIRTERESGRSVHRTAQQTVTLLVCRPRL